MTDIASEMMQLHEERQQQILSCLTRLYDGTPVNRVCLEILAAECGVLKLFNEMRNKHAVEG